MKGCILHVRVRSGTPTLAHRINRGTLRNMMSGKGIPATPHTRSCTTTLPPGLTWGGGCMLDEGTG